VTVRSPSRCWVLAGEGDVLSAVRRWFAADGRAALRRRLGAFAPSGCVVPWTPRLGGPVVSAGSAAGWARALRAVVGGPGVRCLYRLEWSRRSADSGRCMLRTGCRGGSGNASGFDDPLGGAAGEVGDHVEVAVVVQDGGSVAFGAGGDDEVG
jgi:hypothetical protein